MKPGPLFPQRAPADENKEVGQKKRLQQLKERKTELAEKLKNAEELFKKSNEECLHAVLNDRELFEKFAKYNIRMYESEIGAMIRSQKALLAGFEERSKLAREFTEKYCKKHVVFEKHHVSLNTDRFIFLKNEDDSSDVEESDRLAQLKRFRPNH